MNVINIANAFLNKVSVNAVENGYGMSSLKLQRLIYFAQKEHIYRTGNPLFNEEIEKWRVHGPIVRKVWNKFQGVSIIEVIPDTVNLDKEIQETIDNIWDKYGDKDLWYLWTLICNYDSIS